MGILDKIFDNDDKNDKNKKNADFSDVRSHADTSAAARPRADFSDVVSSSSTSAPADGGDTYTVASGDTLSKIAKRHYGDANKWHQIFEANKDTIKDPDLIYPGQTLNLPSV
ncbi:MAG: LysM peptidoglycan-binding domain-containing protein [Gemmatimonadaceae bacterium]